MSLATRCPACQTVFRVVQDQLRVSEGWVRCGRCAEVFNALEHMVEVAKPASVATPAANAGLAPPPTAAAPAVDPIPTGTPDLSDGAEHRVVDATIVAISDGVPGARVDDAAPDSPSDVMPIESAPAEGFDLARSDLADSAPAESDLALTSLLELRPGEREEAGALAAAIEAAADLPPVAEQAHAPSSTPIPTPAAEALPAAAAEAANDATSTELPSFLRKVERAERWQRPAVRRALAAVLVLGLLGLALQVSLTYRDLIAARWPETRQALVPLCQALGCRIEQPRWIEAVVVDSTGLTRVEGTATYKLQVVLRNRSGMALALPWLDVSLTDSQGRLVSRRALSPQQLGASVASLAANGDLSLQATLAVGDKGSAAVSGYTIEVFYP